MSFPIKTKIAIQILELHWTEGVYPTVVTLGGYEPLGSVERLRAW